VAPARATSPGRTCPSPPSWWCWARRPPVPDQERRQLSALSRIADNRWVELVRGSRSGSVAPSSLAQALGHPAGSGQPRPPARGRCPPPKVGAGRPRRCPGPGCCVVAPGPCSIGFSSRLRDDLHPGRLLAPSSHMTTSPGGPFTVEPPFWTGPAAPDRALPAVRRPGERKASPLLRHGARARPRQRPRVGAAASPAVPGGDPRGGRSTRSC